MTTATSPPEIRHTSDEVVPDCPYVGLVPFGEQHSPFFFGRERESEIIVANLAAARLTLLFAPSGVGKSSVLRAGVLPRLRNLREDDDEDEAIARTTIAVAYVSDWSAAPLESAAVTIQQAVAAATETTVDSTAPPPRLDAEWVRHLIDTAGVAMLYLVLDQFEEYFFYHAADSESDKLTVVLGEILSDRELNVHVLLSVREDTLAGLDRFKGRIPHLFGNYLRLAHLTHDAARSAIEGPLGEYNRRVAPGLEMSVEPALIDDLLEQVHTGSVVVERDGPASDSRDTDSRGGIETPYLQLVLTRLWEQERAAGSRTLRQHTLAELGGAQTVVQSHLDNVIAGLPPEQVPVAAEVFRHLVTASGAKIALRADDLADWSGEQVTDVQSLLERLSSGPQRILRPVPPAVGTSGPPRYEIFHDVMGIAVLDWRRRYTAERREIENTRHLVEEREEAQAVARTARRRLRTTLLTVALVAALLLAGGLLVWGNYREARKQASLSESAAAAGTSHDASLSRALDALWWSDDAESRSAVLQAASTPGSQVVAGPGATGGGPPMIGMEVTPSGDRVVAWSRDGRVVVADPAGRRLADVQVDGLGGTVVDAAPAPDASRVALATDRGGVAIVDIASGRRVQLNSGVRGGADVSWLGVGGDGTVLVVDPGRKAATFDSASGKPIATFPGSVYWAIGIDEGRRVVTSDGDSRLRVWDARTGAKLAESETLLSAPLFLQQHERTIVGVAQGASSAAELVVWNWEKGPKAVRTTFSYSNEILDLTIDKQSNAALVAFDKQAREFSLIDGSLLKIIPQQPDWVDGVAVSGDGQWLATAGGDGRTLVWAAGSSEPSRPTYELLGEGHAAFKSEFVGSGLIALESNGNVRRWDLPRPSRFRGHLNWVLDLDLSSDGRWLATAGTEGDGYVLNPGDLSQVAKFGDRLVALEEVHVDPTDPHRVIALGRYDSVPHLWQWKVGGQSLQPTYFRDPQLPSFVVLVSLGFSPDGRTVVAGDSVGGVHFWDSRSGELLRDREQPGDGSWAKVAYGPGDLLATTVQGGIRLTGSGSTQSLSHPNAISVAFDRKGERLASVGDGVVRVWSVDGELLNEFRADESRLGRASFSSDGTLIAVGTASGLVQVWDIESGVSVALVRQHSDTVNDVVFAPGGNSHLISASDDNSVADWPCPACTDQQAVIRDARNGAGR